MRSLVWINGKILPRGRAVISAFDSAYLYGFGLFETLRAQGGNIPFLSDHLNRLGRNARFLNLKLPYSHGRLVRAVSKTLAKSRLKDATLRINLSRSEGGGPSLVIFVKPYLPYPRSCYRRGGRLILVRSVRNDLPPLSTVKTTNYLTKMLARREIARRRAVEGVLLNARGRVTEGASSNIFTVMRGRFYTPPISDGLMPGIRRGVVMRLARRLGYRMEEWSLFPRDLVEADEIFVTSTLKGILPIRTFEGRRIGKACPGSVTTRLMRAWEACVSGCVP